MRISGIVVSLLMACAQVHAAYATQRIGNFLVYPLEAKFGDGAGLAASTSVGNSVLNIHCMKEALTVEISDSHSRVGPGEQFSVQFRADDKPIIESAGATPEETPEQKGMLGENSGRFVLIAITWAIQLEKSEAIIDALSGAKKASFHLARKPDASFDLSFPLSQSDKVVALLKKKGCGKSSIAQPFANHSSPAGDWFVRAVQRSPRYLGARLRLISPGNTLDITCRENGSWSAAVQRRDIGFNPGYTDASLSYSIDAAPVVSISGKLLDQDSIDVDESANALISQILTAKKTISFAAGSSTEMATVDLSDAHEAIAPLLDHCPLEK